MSHDILGWELKFYEIGMECGLEGEELNKYVAHMIKKWKFRRIPEPIFPIDALLPGDNPYP